MKKTLRIYGKFQMTAIALVISSTSIVANANTSVAPPLSLPSKPAAPVIDNTTNPPSISIIGNKLNSSWLLYNKYGKWTNVNAEYIDQGSSITALNFTVDPSNPSHVLEVLGHTSIKAIGTAKDDGSAGIIEGISISQSDSSKEQIRASFNSVDIFVESKDPQLSRAKGIWIYGGYNPFDPDAEALSEAQVSINGDLKITSKSKTLAYGINVGDEFGNSNGKGGGHLTLNGKTNEITVIQTGNPNTRFPDGYLACGALGILVSQNADVIIHSDETTIRTETHLADIRNLGLTQGGIAVNYGSSLVVDNKLSVDSTATNDSQGHYLYGITTDNIASYVAAGKKGSMAHLKGQTDITVRPNKNTVAMGLSSFGGSEVTADGHVNVVLGENQKIESGWKKFSAVYAGSTYNKGWLEYKPDMEGGLIHLNGGLSVSLPSFAKPGQSNIYALLADGEAKDGLNRQPVIWANGTANDIYQLNGNVDANRDGRINLTMANSASYLTGWANNHVLDTQKDGFIDMHLKDGATWNVISKLDTKGQVSSDVSAIDSLELQGGMLNMAYASKHKLTEWENEGHRQVLTISGTGAGQGLTGTGGTIWMDINLADEGSESTGLNLDQIIVKGEASGSHQLGINFVNGLASVPKDKWHSDNWLIEQAAGSMSLTGPNGDNSFTGSGMVSMWTVKFVAEGEESKLDTDRESLDNTSQGKPNNGKGHWYLVRDDQPVVLPPEVADNINIGTSATQALAYQADLEDLRTRLGEVRYGAQDGAWVKVFTKKEQIGSGNNLEQEVDGINVGVDALITENEDAAWLVGGAFRYSSADQKGLAGRHISGELDEYSLKAYATWMQEKGSYADFVLQAGRYEQTIDGLDNTSLDKSHADYNTWGFGASVEVGHMFAFDEGVDDRRWFNHWFVEPQLQLSYFHAKGADYTTSTGLKIEQGNADFLTGRAGLVIGKKFNYGTENDLDRRYFQIAAIGGVKHEFLGGDQTIHYTGTDNERLSVKANELSGTRYYYGVNADWQLGNQWRVYGQIAREEGDDYTKEYDISLGLKYQF